MANQGEVIRDAAEAILRVTGKPLHSSELAELVRTRVPRSLNVSRKSVYNYLYDAPTRFFRPEPGMWSLKDQSER